MEQRLQELKEKIYMFCGVPKERLYEKEIPITAGFKKVSNITKINLEIRV